MAILVAGLLFHFDMRDVVGPVMLWPALALIAAGLLTGFLIDYLQPAPIRADSRRPTDESA